MEKKLFVRLEIERGPIKVSVDTNGITLRRGNTLEHQATWHQLRAAALDFGRGFKRARAEGRA